MTLKCSPLRSKVGGKSVAKPRADIGGGTGMLDENNGRYRLVGDETKNNGRELKGEKKTGDPRMAKRGGTAYLSLR